MTSMEARTLMTEVTPPPRKFLFDLAFDDESGMPLGEREKQKPTFSQEQLDAARQEGYEAGLKDGAAAAQESQAQRLSELLAQVEQRLGKLIQDSAAEWQSQLGQLQSIALVIARKLLPTYVETHGLAEIESIVTRVVAEMSREPRLVIRVPEKYFDETSARINAIATNEAYAGKVVILGDPELGDSDCRVEWADGGIERDTRAIWDEIDRVLAEVQTPDQPSEPEAETHSEQPASVEAAPQTGERT